MSKHKTLSADELNSWILSDKTFTLIDVIPKEYFQDKRLPRAINACIYEVSFLDNVNKEVSTKDEQIVVYSTSENCMASTVAAETLINAGYCNIHEYKGGILEWESKNYQIVGDNPSVRENDKDLFSFTDKVHVVNSSKSVLQWSGDNLNSTHSGTLKISEGEIEIKNGSVSGGHFIIDMDAMTCIDIADETYNKILITHLKADDLFAVNKYPQAKFLITSIDSITGSTPGNYNFNVKGDLTIKDITKNIEFPAIISIDTDNILVFLAQVEIDRTEWNILYGSGTYFQKLGMHLLNDLINIQFRVIFQ